MKKVLLASTALVAMSSYAFAAGHEGVSVSGEANAGVKYTEDATNETVLHYELDFAITGVGTSDSGLEFGASIDFDLDDEDESADIDDPEVFISGSFGTVTVGAVDSASDNLSLGISDIGFDGIGIDDLAEAYIGAGDADILYEFSTGAFSLAATASVADGDDDSTDDFGIAIGYAFGDIEVQAAYESVDTGAVAPTGIGEADILYLGVEGSAGAISYDLFFHQADGETADIAGYGASVDFLSGDITWTVAVGNTDVDGDDVDFGVGMELDLGGGLAFGAGIGSTGLGDNVTVAEAGFTMAF